MNAVKKIWNRFTTVWAIEDPIDELFHLNKSIESYKFRCKHIINAGLLVAFFYFSFVIISLLLNIYSLTNIFLLSQSFSTSYFVESFIGLFFHLFSLPFCTIVIIFLLQTWKFYEVLINRIYTITKIWDEDTIEKRMDEKEIPWNPMDVNMLILGEMEEQISQVKKQIYISIISLVITSILVLLPAILHIIYTPFMINVNTLITIILPIIFLMITLIIVRYLVELYQFVSWQHQQYNVIDAVYSNPPPITDSQSTNLLSRLKSYLKNDGFLNENEQLQLCAPFSFGNVTFDSGGKTNHTFVFVKTCNSVTPTPKEIKQFHSDIQTVISKKAMKPEYIRAILVCDWRKEEDELPDKIEHQIFKYPINLRKKAGVNVVTYIQIIMDTGRMYSLFPLVPEKNNG